MRKIFVSCLPIEIKGSELKHIFEEYGTVHSIKIYADWKNASFEPYAHVIMDNSEQAIKALDGKQIGMNYLRINKIPKRKVKKID
jgi:RNA recognition motif-containing protein